MPLKFQASLNDDGGVTAAPARTALDCPPAADPRSPRADATLDRLAGLACERLGVPVAATSFVGETDQFFPGAAGLPESHAQARRTPLSQSFCRHVVEAGGPLVVRDARVDARVRRNMAVRYLGVIAYCGVPLRTPDGLVLGAFCAISNRPRDWSEADLAILEELAAATIAVVESRRRALGLGGPACGRAAVVEMMRGGGLPS